MDDAEHELRELRTEVARHHRDFAAIIAVLDAVEQRDLSDSEGLRRIRNIVG